MTDSGYSDSNGFSYKVTHAPDNLSLVSFAQVYPPDDLQAALAQLPQVPPGMGNPEEGSGIPPWILQSLWKLITRRSKDEPTPVEQEALRRLIEVEKSKKNRKSELMVKNLRF